MNDRLSVEKSERDNLAGFACCSADSRGRKMQLDEHPLRTAFQRDRDRIIHSTAFRRMEYKTQVFLPHEGDHYRTRLTHTIEVAQVARTMARSLRLNEDLTEAVALAHDLGHTPFGHAGEDMLDKLLASVGGFNHNRQSLRVIDILEQRYPEFDGLNLSYEVREGIAKHETKATIVTDEFHPDEQPTLEVALVDVADEIAYNAADIDDGIKAGLISLDDVQPLKIVAGCNLSGNFELMSPDQKRYYLARMLVNRMASDTVEHTLSELQKLGISTLASVRAADQKPVGFSPDMSKQVAQLKAFLKERVYHHPHLLKMTKRAHEIVGILYERFDKDPSKMPERFRQMLTNEKKEIVLADYIAGMTDRFAEGLIDSPS
ncbi:MAG: deoxyguanosinetriphosphate triphosphohydrolase [candidate division Zixibacteria bacterium]